MFDTALKYYLGVDGSALSDQEWAAEVARLAELRKRDQIGGGGKNG